MIGMSTKSGKWIRVNLDTEQDDLEEFSEILEDLQGTNCGVSHKTKLILNMKYPELFEMNCTLLII